MQPTSTVLLFSQRGSLASNWLIIKAVHEYLNKCQQQPAQSAAAQMHAAMLTAGWTTANITTTPKAAHCTCVFGWHAGSLLQAMQDRVCTTCHTVRHSQGKTVPTVAQHMHLRGLM
jgi:hypothetical protein